MRDELSVDDVQIGSFENDTPAVWNQVKMRLPALVSGQLIFQYTKGMPYESGVALDDVILVSCDNETISQNHEPEITFEPG